MALRGRMISAPTRERNEFALHRKHGEYVLRGRFVNRPYAGCGADSPGNVVVASASCRVVEDADPYDGTIRNRT